MVFHFGVILELGKISAYDENEKKFINFNVQKVENNDINIIDIFFQEIKSKINNENSSYACVFLSWLFDNNFRKIFLQTGKQNGFEMIQLVDENSFLYLNCIYRLNINPKIDELICIAWQNFCYVWRKKCGTKTLMLDMFTLASISLHFEEEKDYNIQDNAILITFEDSSKMKELKNIFPNNKSYEINDNELDANCMLQKARFMANENIKLSNFDVALYIDTYKNLKVNDNRFMNLEPYRLLPLEETAIVQIKTNENKVKFSIDHDFHDIRLYNEEIQVDFGNLKYPFLQFTLKIDENCIYSMHNLIPVSMKNGESENFVNKFDLKNDGYLYTFRHLATMFAELAKSRFLEKSWYISFSEKKPIYGDKAKETLTEKPTFVVYDLIKLCSITDPKEADPKWPFEVKMHNNEYIVVEFDTFNGRRKATPTFLMALFIGDIINYSMKINKEMLRKTEVRFIDIEKMDILTSTLMKAIKLLNRINDYDLNLFFL